LNGITIRPHGNYEESGLCEWQPDGSLKWYKIFLPQIFPERYRHSIYKSFKTNIKSVHYNFFTYDVTNKVLFISMETNIK
jgi:hypothetical protein